MAIYKKIKIITKQPDKKLYQKVLLSEVNQTNLRNLLPVILLKKKNNDGAPRTPNIMKEYHRYMAKNNLF